MNRVPKEKSVRMPIGARDSYRGLVDKVVPIGKELEKVPFGFCRVRVRGKKGRRWIPESVRRTSAVRVGRGKRVPGWVHRNLVKIPGEVGYRPEAVSVA